MNTPLQSNSSTAHAAHRRALLNFQHYSGQWSVCFVEADGRTAIGKKTKYIDIEHVDDLRAFVKRCNPEPGEWEDFERALRQWGRGSVFVNLTQEQYLKLR